MADIDPRHPMAPPPLGRCRKCGRLSWLADDISPVHPCCVRLYDVGDGDCEACVTSDSLDRQAARVRQWARRTDERTRAD